MLRAAMTTTPSLPARPRIPAAFWWICALGALPVAALAAWLGYGLPIVSPQRELALLALVSIVEEIVFRGGVQRALLKTRLVRPLAWQITRANLATSLVFALAHLWNHRPLVALAVVPASLLLGWAYERSGERLAPPIFLHLYFNLVLVACSQVAKGLVTLAP